MKIIAHRGSSTIWPENTMFAFEQAENVGAEGFETDLRLSADEEIILAHDDNLQRFGLPEKTVSALNAEEVCRIEIPSPDGKHQGRIITLKMLLDRFPEKSYIFDLKITSELLMQKLKLLLKDLNFHNRIWFLTWSQKADDLVARYFPGYACFPRENITRRWGLSSILGMGALVQPTHKILSLPPYFNGLPVFKKKQIARLHADAREFVGYIVNTEKAFRRCCECGVQTILTDRPDLTAKLRQVK